MNEREDGNWAGLSALPDIASDEDPATARQLVCDGETFELRPERSGGTHYTWLSGPNPGYGFTVSPTADDIEEHQKNIRRFLSNVDPVTGHIEDD